MPEHQKTIFLSNGEKNLYVNMIDNKTQQAVIHKSYIYVRTQNNLIGPAFLIVLISYMAGNHDGFTQLAVGKRQKAHLKTMNMRARMAVRLIQIYTHNKGLTQTTSPLLYPVELHDSG